MEPWFLVTERFDARCGASCRDCVKWAQLPQVVEIVSADAMPCPHVVGDLQPDDWEHNVAEDFLLHFFRDVDHLVRRCGGIESRNLLCVFREPERHPDPLRVGGLPRDSRNGVVSRHTARPACIC